jgi:hypothetical protein
MKLKTNLKLKKTEKKNRKFDVNLKFPKWMKVKNKHKRKKKSDYA